MSTRPSANLGQTGSVKGVLFDLDGTFADTAPDLAAALNHTRATRNLPPLPLDVIRPQASHGSRGLLKLGFGIEPGHSDPEGETTAESLKELRYSVERVNVSKVYEVYLQARSLEEAEKHVDEMCRKLLANPTKDDYRFDVEELK